MTSMVLGYSTLEYLTPSLNAPKNISFLEERKDIMPTPFRVRGILCLQVGVRSIPF
jgi:hypothetical protein